MRFARRFFVLAIFLAAAGTAAAQGKTKDEFLRNGPEMFKAFRPVIAKSSEATVRVLADSKPVAYGTVVEADGLILTKWDEIRGARRVVCRTHDGKELLAKVIGVEKDYDLAMLKVDASDLPTVQWEDIKKATVGRWVASVGTGDDPLAVGVISVAKRKLVPGDQPAKNVNVNAGYMGVSLADADMGAKIVGFGSGIGNGKKKGGAEKTPAEKAGLKIDDIVYEAAGRKVGNAETLIGIVGRMKAGDEVLLKVMRGEEELEITIKLGKRPVDLGVNPQEVMGTKLSNRRGGFPFILQHDSGLDPRDCGGPLVDIDGKTVGINITRAGRTETYAIPADEIQALMPKFKNGDFAIKEEAVQEAPPAKEPEPILRKTLSLAASDKLDKDRAGLKGKRHVKIEEIDLKAGETYIIDMRSDDVDSYLVLEDAKGTRLAEDDSSGGFPNARIVHKAGETGTYRIICTSYNPGETGSFTLTVRVQPGKSKK